MALFFYIIGLSQVSVFGRPDYAVFVLCFFGFVQGWCCGLSAAGTKVGSTRPTPPREQTTNFDADDMSFVCQLSKADGAVYKCFPIFVFIPVRRWIHPLRFQFFFFFGVSGCHDKFGEIVLYRFQRKWTVSSRFKERGRRKKKTRASLCVGNRRRLLCGARSRAPLRYSNTNNAQSRGKKNTRRKHSPFVRNRRCILGWLGCALVETR